MYTLKAGREKVHVRRISFPLVFFIYLFWKPTPDFLYHSSAIMDTLECLYLYRILGKQATSSLTSVVRGNNQVGVRNGYYVSQSTVPAQQLIKRIIHYPEMQG